MKRSGFLKRRKRLKPKSAKRRKLDDEIKPIREAWLRLHERCMWPGCREAAAHVHEILGGCFRAVTVREPCFWLGLCAGCHRLAHDRGRFPYAFQLAAKLLSRSGHEYDLGRFCVVWGGRIGEAAVHAAAEQIRKERAA